MDHLKRLCFVAFGSFLSSFIFLYECRKLDGYKFPVYSTQSCPSNETEWEARSSVFNCQGESSYACFPNENITELLEFCYPLEVISIHEGNTMIVSREKYICLFLVKDRSEVDSYDCQQFVQGCPTGFYSGSTVYKYPSCILIGNGCFLADPSCKRFGQEENKDENTANATLNSVTQEPFLGNSSVNTTQRTLMENAGSQWISIATILGMLLLTCVASILLAFFLLRRRKSSKRKTLKRDNESQPLMINNSQDVNNEDTEFEKSVFGQWQQDDNFFYSTKATKEVENLIKNSNLVMVTGHSGSGKSAIIQHIALKYRKEGWIVKPVYSVEEIHNAYKSMTLKNTRCIFVFNDPIGRESFNEILHNKWGCYRETINIFLKNGKLLMTCRKSIISDQRAKGFFKEDLKQIDINDSHFQLTKEEKKNIFKKHLPNKQLDEEDFTRVYETDLYFPLLCKLCKFESVRNKTVLNFFEEPVEVLKDEIESYKNSDKEKYCALVCLILSNNELCINDLKGNNELLSQCLQLCELPDYISTSIIKKKLDSLEGFFVKKIGKTYSFYHDFVLEVTTYVFGSEHPEETIKFADLSFLRNRICIENSQCNDFLTIALNEDNIVHLVNRLFEEMFDNRFIEVVLNPCLRNEHVIWGLKTKLKCLADEKKLALIIKPQKKTIKQDLKNLMDDSSYSRLEFVNSERESSPLFALIAFCHDALSTFCLNLLRRENIDLKRCGVFSAICSNGNEALVRMFEKDEICEYMDELWGNMYPIHIMSLFHNYNLLDYVIKTPEDVNRFSPDEWMWTPLHLASMIDDRHVIKNRREESTESVRRDKTVGGLIQRGADVNLCNNYENSPLWVACKNGHTSTAQLLLQFGAKVNKFNIEETTPILEACKNGHENTVQLLLKNGAEVNIYDRNKISPLLEACRNGLESTVQLLLQCDAKVNLCDMFEQSPLLIACLNGHKRTVQLLLQNGAEVNTSDANGATPLLIACEQGHESTVQLLLQNGTDVNIADKNGTTALLAACKKGHKSIVQLILVNGADVNETDRFGFTPLFEACKNGHESTVQLLLKNRADVNIADENGITPLLRACENGHKSTVQLLLQCNAKVNLCDMFEQSPLLIACLNGHNSIAQLLLQYVAEVNKRDIDETTPLLAACWNGHKNIVQLLLQNGAVVNTGDTNGSTPLLKACEQGNESTVLLLLQYGAKINIPDENRTTPLLEACKNGHENIVQLLLQNGAEVNIPDKNGTTPLLEACKNGHESTFQLLLQNGADVNIPDENGITPLLEAHKNWT